MRPNAITNAERNRRYDAALAAAAPADDAVVDVMELLESVVEHDRDRVASTETGRPIGTVAI